MNHHPTLSPSSFPAMDQCPCFKSSGEDTDANVEGMIQHADLEDSLNLGAVAPNVTPGVEWAFHKIRDMFESYSSEIKLHLLKDFQEVTYGTADVLGYLKNGYLAVGDYKSGQQRDSSAQLAVYALMAMQKHGEIACRCFIWYGRDEWEESWILTIEEAEAIVYGIIESTDNPESKLCDYCNWCKHEGVCSATTTAIATIATSYEPEAIDIEDIETWHTSEITDPAQMAKVYRVACVISKWADSAKHHAKEAVQKGMVLPGFKLRNGAKKRHIADIEAAYNASGMSPSEFLACCSVSVADLEKKLTTSRSVKGKKAIATMMDEVFGDTIYIKENAPSLVAEKEKK